MQYNIWFNVCALFVLAALLVLYYAKFHAPFRKYQVYISMVWLSTASTIASICNNALVGTAPIWVLRITNILYFLSHGLILPVLLLYVYSLMDYGLRNWQRLIPWLIPSAFHIMLVVTCWYSDGLFTLDAIGTYSRGPLIPLLYVITAYNFVIIGYFLKSRWSVIPLREGVSIVIFLAISVTAVVVQLLYPWLLVENFAAALCMMLSQMMVQNPELILDGSTGMLTKHGFSNLISPQFEDQQPFPICFVLVDNYHELEQNYSYSRLEEQVTILAEYLKQHIGCTFSRMDTHLFCITSDNLLSGSGWSRLLQDLDEENLVARLEQIGLGIPFQLKIGILNCPRDVDSFSGLLEMIDTAAKLPMKQDVTVMHLTQADILRLRRRKAVDALVRTAVQDGSLSLVFQPVYDVVRRRFCGAEALLRMHTTELGTISPAEFIPIAEENGAILQIGQFVVENVCHFLQSSQLTKDQLQKIHINLSALDCAQKDLSARILRTMQSMGVSTDRISVEITETAFSALPDSVLENLKRLSDAGISILLDDYGTGYSNLNRLYRMPLDMVKVDKSLVDDVLSSPSARIILENTLQMMSSLNKKVLIEGVETKEQADYLISQGVHFIQGYYFAKPMDMYHLEALFHDQPIPALQ